MGLVVSGELATGNDSQKNRPDSRSGLFGTNRGAVRLSLLEKSLGDVFAASQDCFWSEQGYVFANKEPMTYQVGMVAKNGVLLGSDTAHSLDGFSRSGYQAGKIQISQNGNIAYCAAGGDLAHYVGESIIQSKLAPPKDESDDALKTWFFIQIHAAIGEQMQRGLQEHDMPRYGGYLLVAIKRQTVELWRLTAGTASAKSLAVKILDKVCHGDRPNTAAFFGEHCFPPDHMKMPVESLRLLAAHSILMAGATNPAHIKGLEIAECRMDRFEILPLDEISRLTDQSAKLDAEIKKSLALSTASTTQP